MWSDRWRVIAWSEVVTRVLAVALGIGMVLLLAWSMRPTPQQDAAQVRGVGR